MYESSILGLAAITVDEKFSVPLQGFCNCSRHIYPTFNTPLSCNSLPFVSPTVAGLRTDITLNKSSVQSFAIIVENPREFKNQELLRLTCNYPEEVIFTYLTLPMGFNQVLNLTEDFNKFVKFYQDHFNTRPRRLFGSGAKILIKLMSKVFQDLDGKVSPDGRHINSHISRSSIGNPLHTEIVLSWDSSMFGLIKKVKTGSYLQLLKLVATFGLSLELLCAMYSRFRR